jgi:hypothetical protein
MKFILPKLLDQSEISVAALNILLGNGKRYSHVLNSPEITSKVAGHPERVNVIPCLLSHGLLVDTNEGALLLLAIQAEDLNVLRILLNAQPRPSTLRIALRAASNSKSDSLRVQMMELILQQRGKADINQADLLQHVLERALKGDLRELKLLLAHVESVSAINLQTAANAGNFEVIDLLLSCKPTLQSVHTTCLTTSLNHLDLHRKEKMLDCLLTAHGGEYATDLPKLLELSLFLRPESDLLPIMLAERGTVPSQMALEAATKRASLNVFAVLVGYLPEHGEATKFLDFMQRQEFTAERRYHLYKCLLAKGLPKQVVASTMISWLRRRDLTHLDTLKILLENGAQVESDGGVAFALAHDAGSADAFKLLCQHVTDDKTANIALRLALDAPFTSVLLMQIFRSLLSFTINSSVLDLVFLRSMTAFRDDVSFLQSLIKKGADPSHCFTLACKTGSEKQVRALARGVDLNIVLPALIASFAQESEVVRCINMALEEQTAHFSLRVPGILMQCLHKFPNGSALLRLMSGLDLSVDTTTSDVICPGSPAEQCTALLYALAPQSGVSDDAIKVLLSRGADLGMPFRIRCLERLLTVV